MTDREERKQLNMAKAWHTQATRTKSYPEWPEYVRDALDQWLREAEERFDVKS
jgi:hypothetical protein